MSFWNRVLGFLAGDTTPVPTMEIEPMASDLSGVPQVITDGLADVQAKFTAHQASNAAVVTKQAALTQAQTEVNSAVADQQSTGQAVVDALAKLDADITAAYTDPVNVELVAKTS